MIELLKNGDRIQSPGGMFTYLVVGPCCQLFDREELPYLRCNMRGKFREPSWNRIGKRFVADRSVSKRASYSIQQVALNGAFIGDPKVIVYWKEISKKEIEWWYSKAPHLRQIYQGEREDLAA